MAKFENFRRHGGSSRAMDFKTLKEVLVSSSIEAKTRSNIICSLMDIRNGFLDDLESFPENIRDHETLKDWLLIFLENNYEEIEDISLKKNLSEELLVKIGFQEGSEAIQTILKRSKLVPDHVDPIDAATRFLIDEFKYHPVLSSLYGPSKQDSDSQKLQRISVLVLPGVSVSREGFVIIEYESSMLFSTECSSILCQDDSHTILYHGTDLQSAQDICVDGIDVNCGFRRRDFSDGNGFYLTNSYVHTMNWAFSQTQKPVVLVFKIPTRCLQEAKHLDLTEETKQSQWLEIITQNRAGKPTKKMRTSSGKYDFIEGPMSVLSTDSERTAEYACERQQPREELLESYQLCITSDDFADKISECLATIITYEESV